MNDLELCGGGARRCSRRDFLTPLPHPPRVTFTLPNGHFCVIYSRGRRVTDVFRTETSVTATRNCHIILSGEDQ